MSISIARPLTVLLISLPLLGSALGCGSDRSGDANTPGQIGPLRFAGVDLVYALERIAAESGLLLALDEIKARDMSPDLGLYRVDVDLPAGSPEAVLRALKESVGGFDFELTDGLLYVRSQTDVTLKTPLDLPTLKAEHFKGHIGDLVKYIMGQVPRSFLSLQRAVKDPEAVTVEFDIPEGSSIKDVLLQYARAAKHGWTINRAGFATKDAKHGNAIVATTIQLRHARKTTSRKPQLYNRMSTIGALASTTTRLREPMVVFDRSVLMTTRGMLNYSLLVDPGLPLQETLSGLAQSGWAADRWYFKWSMVDGVAVIESNRFLFFLRGRDLFREPLLSGEFDGSLPELARWINTHLRNPSGEVLMGGEIVEGLPRGKFTVTSGMTVEDALVAFARSSGVSEYVVVLDLANPLTGKTSPHPQAWRGAYLQALEEWVPTLEDADIGDYIPTPK